MSEHRASMLGGSLRRYEDPARSSDPRIREIVAALATIEPAPAPRAHFRAELRAQLVAVAPRIVQESATEELPAVGAARKTAKPSPGRSILSGLLHSRPLAAVACTVVIIAMLLGGAVAISRNALPGSTLYGLKRASENAQYALAQSSSARARLNLSFAQTRLEEVQALLPGGSGTAAVSPHLASLVDSTLSSADSDVMKAAQTLGEQAVQNNSATPLQSMTSWAPSELTRLNKIIGRLPSGPVRDRAQASYALVSDAMTRANALSAEAGCACLKSTTSDQLGPIPCPVCDSSPTPVVPTGVGTLPTLPGGTVPGSSSTSGGTGTGNGQSSGGGGVVVVPPSSGGDTNSAQPTHPTIPLPSVSVPPLPSVSLGPIGIGSCGAGISLGPINIHLGKCPSPS